MQFERAARASGRRRGPGLTPLIDVVFLLLVFFMLATRFERESLLPLSVQVTAPAAAPATDAPTLRIEIGADGSVRIEGRAVGGAELQTAAADAARDGRAVRLQPQPETQLQPIVDVLAALRSAGASDVSIEKSQERSKGKTS